MASDKVEQIVRDFFKETADDLLVGVAWDGCHKIYIVDEGSYEQMVGYGYGQDEDGSVLERIADHESAIVSILRMWDDSCFLRFIQHIQYKDLFEVVIPQGFEEESDEDEDYWG